MTENDTTTPAVAPTYEKGTWQHNLNESGRLADRSTAAKKKAGQLLWTGAKDAIGEWDSSADADGEGLFNSLVEVMGKTRKPDASKIKMVAMAVTKKGLVLDNFENLSKAYAEARRLTDTATAAAHKAEDEAVESAVESIAESAPKSSSTPEGAALIVLSKGVDEAARLLLDALNGVSETQNNAAHRAFMRAISDEVAGRIPKPEPKEAKAPIAKDGAEKPKASAKPKARATPTSRSKGDPNAKALPPKAKPVEKADAPAEVFETVDDDVIDAIMDDPETADPEVVAPKAPSRRKGAPVARR